MENAQFEKWCREATRDIRFTPDRRAVYGELMAHLEDHRDSLLEQGCSQKEAESNALEAMGKAWEVAPLLAQVHPPFWGYAYRVTRVAAIALCGILLVGILLYGGNMLRFYLQTNDGGRTLAKNPPEPAGWEAVTLVHPDATVYESGYWIRISDSILWKSRAESRLSFHLQIYFLPPLDDFHASGHFWAVDDQGNHYSANSVDASENAHCIRYGGGTFTQGCWSVHTEICGIPTADLQWMEVHYGRDGRDIVLHIDLTGGDTP